jgi:hypothetical protein
MGRSKKKPQRNPPRRVNVRADELTKHIIDSTSVRTGEAIASVDKRVVGFVQAFQQNLNQIFMNQKAIGDMAYTNNVHITVMREVLYYKGILTKEEYESKVEKELSVRDAIQKRHTEELIQLSEELKKKQAEEAATKIATVPAPSEHIEESKVFGGDFKEESVGQAVQRE